MTLPIEDGIKVEAYRAPEFESNIVSTQVLSETYDVTFSSHFLSYNACFFFRPDTRDIVAEYPLKESMYPTPMLRQPSAMKVNPSIVPPKCNDVDEWHHKVGHPHPEPFYKLSQMFQEVPCFERAALQEHQ